MKDHSIQCHTFFYDNLQLLYQMFSAQLANNIQLAIKKRGVCHMVFPGGRTPRPIFELLITKSISWSKLHLYPTDERCVPLHSDERNDRLIEDLLFPFVPLPEGNLHRIPAELGAEKAAHLYQKILQSTPPFDIAWIGVGEDGHIASLFPGSELLKEKTEALAVYNSPKFPAERVTIGLSCLQKATERWVIIIGKEKHHLYTQMEQDPMLPISQVEPTQLFILK